LPQTVRCTRRTGWRARSRGSSGVPRPVFAPRPAVY
jgi:hypothetical protein